MMMKRVLLFMFLILGFQYTGNAQITAPATAASGVPVTFSGPPGKATYTWSYEPTQVDMNTSIPSTMIATVTQPQHVSVLNDKGHWYAFVISQSTRSLMRIDLGSDPTAVPADPATAIANLGVFTYITRPEIGTSFIYDSTSGNWHAFIAQIGDATTTSYLMIRRLDFGNSLANAPTAVKVNTPASAGAQVCDITAIKENNEYILFVTHRSGGSVRVDLGTDITNVNPVDVVALPALSKMTSMALYQQNGLWYGLMVHTDNGTLRRFDFGPTGLKNNTPTITTVGSNVIGAGNNWATRVVAGNCGQQLVSYVNSANVIKRLNFNGDITSTPAAATTVNGTTFSGNNMQGFYPYVFRDTLYAMTTSYTNNAVYNMKLSNMPAGTQQKYADPALVHTFSTPGVYNVSLVTNMDGNASRVSCHSITVLPPAPAQPGVYSVSKSVVCRKESNITYTVPAVSGATSYEWLYTGGIGVTFSGGVTTTTPTNNLSFSASATGGTLQVRAVNAGGSSAYRDLSITVNTLPVVSTTNTGARSVCEGDSLQLSATATGVNYQWKNGTTNVGANNATYFAKTAGSYTVIVTSTATGCSDTSASATILSVNPLPVVTTTNSGAQSICDGDSLLLSATATGVSYQWKNGTTNIGTNSPAYHAKAAGSYTVTVTSTTTNCSATSTPTTITIKPLPTVTVNNTGARPVCAGDSLLLSATATGVNYQWKNGSTNVGTNSPGYYAKAVGTYMVTVTSTTTNCSATSTPATTISINPLPVLSVTNTGNQAICSGDSLLLSVTATGVNYQWKNGSTNVGTGASYNAKVAGDYTVTVTGTTTNCSATSTPATTVTIKPLPVVTATNTGTQSICAGDSLQLSATATGVNYQWKHGSNNVGTNSAGYYAHVAGNYTVTVTSTTTNCSATSAPATTLSVNPLPTVTVSTTPPSVVCVGDSVTLTASAGNNYTYQWKDGSAYVGTGGNIFMARTTGDYSVVATDGNTGCKDSTATVPVVVHARPVVSLIPGDTSFCEGGVVTLNISTLDTGLNYRWKNGAATIPLATAYFLEISETGIYTVVAGRSQVANCADSTNEVVVTVHPLPATDITWDGLLFHATPGHAGYQWNTGGQGIAGATDSTFQPSTDGGYSVTVTDSNGCSRTSAVFNVRVGVDNEVALAAQIKIYPNPSNGLVHIDAPGTVQATLSSMEGKLLLRIEQAKLIDMRAYADGVYLLRITDSNGVLIRNEKLVMRNW